jgi:hypothetical protein
MAITAPRYTVHLDEPASTRWSHIITIYKTQIQQTLQSVNTLFSGTLKSIASSLFEYASDYNYIMYNDELISIARQADVKLGDLIMMQLAYEMFACCTCAVFKIEDQPIHIRTMDWEMSALKKLTIEVDFQRNNKTVFLATTWAGYVGVFTGLIPNVCSIALNYRTTGDGTLTNIWRLIRSKWPAGFLIRNILETCQDYQTIAHLLSNTQLVSPCYFTICGINDFQVITRDRDREIRPQKEKSYVVQTNNDHDDKSNNILFSNERRALAKKLIKKSKKLDYDEITQKFWTYPIINPVTIYFTIMNPKGGYLSTKILA